MINKYTKLEEVAKRSSFTKVVSLIGLATLMPTTAQAQKLGKPGGWRVYNQVTDNFNDRQIGWQWNNTHRFYNWERSKRKNGSLTWTKFRTQNIDMNGSQLRVINFYHSTPITEGGRTFSYSGGVLGSKANWLVEGQFQCYSKVQWNMPDIWPTFWTDKGGADELDIMEYQSNIVNHSHHDKQVSGARRSSKRIWAPWTKPKWHHDWALTRVRSWTHWAARTTRNTQATFYINGKREHTSEWNRVDTGMEMLFTSSPHKDHLPNPGGLPTYTIDWVETHIP